MSKKQAIIFLFCAIFIGLLAIKPFNYFCKATSYCNPINISYYLPKKTGKAEIDIIFQAKDNSDEVEFKALDNHIKSLTGKNITAKFSIKNLTTEKISVRPRRFIKPIEAMQYLEFYDCLCFQEYEIAPKSQKEISVRFRIKPEIEESDIFKERKALIILGYELD